MAGKPLVAKPVKKQTLAQQMAGTIQELILSGELESDAVLPTEPELAGQFGVSRAVVRDATRILMAQGLVEVKHGRGVFVTNPNNEAFGEALLLALKRVQATAWDVEQFEQIIFPEVVALAAKNASDEEIAHIRQLVEAHIALITDFHRKWWQKTPPPAEQTQLMADYRRLMQAIFAATHNLLFQQLAPPLVSLRNLRNWADSKDDTLDDLIAIDAGYTRQLVEAIAGRDPAQARLIAQRLMELPPEAIAAMQQTPVGEISEIPIPFPKGL